MTKSSGAENVARNDGNGLAFIMLMTGISMAALVALGPLIPPRSLGVSAADLKAGNYICGRTVVGCIPLRK